MFDRNGHRLGIKIINYTNLIIIKINKVISEEVIAEIVEQRTAAAAAQIAQIEVQKKARLAELDKQYAVQDKIKNTAGIIGLVSIFTLCSVIISLDLFNLIVYLCTKQKIDKVRSKSARPKITKPIYIP